MKNDSNVRLPDEQVYDILSNTQKGPRNHLICDCPLCGKQRHFYFNVVTQKWDCKKCGRSGGIIQLLSSLGKLNLIRRFVDVTKTLQTKLSIVTQDVEEVEESQVLPRVRFPVGFQYLHQNEYLESRGFSKDDFLKYPVGQTKLVEKFKDYVIFPVFEDKEPKGFVSRKTWSKWEFSRHESEFGWAPPRYANSKTNFQLLLYGLDEIMFYVDTVILVEGIFTKIACDRRLDIQEGDPFRCLATFGKKISKHQITKLLLRGIRNVILIFDSDAVSEAYKYGRQLQGLFDKVEIGFVSGGDLDECSDEDFLHCFQNLMEPIEFKHKILQQSRLI